MNKEEAIEILKDLWRWEHPNWLEKDIRKALDKGIEALENQKTGHWIIYRLVPNGYDHIKCSVCGQFWSVSEHNKVFKYCFNCGAKMKGENK